MNIKDLLIGGAVGALVVAGFVYFTPDREPVGGAGTFQTEAWTFNDGLYAKELRIGGSVTTVSTTSASYTLSLNEMKDATVIEIASLNSPALTLTLPATSTWATLLPNDGDMREWIIDNQHAAATTTTIAASEHVDLVAVTTNDDVIDGLEMSRLTCWNKAADGVGGVACIVSELLKAD
jgi:hypothetical protein